MKLSTKYFISIGIIIILLSVFALATFPKSIENKTYNNIRYINSYAKCGHETEKDQTVPTTVFDTEKIKRDFPEYNAKISGNVLELTQRHNNYCERHYFAYLKDNVITIIRLNDNFTLRQFNIVPDVLTESELKSLKSGVELFDTYELTNFIEDYSS